MRGMTTPHQNPRFIVVQAPPKKSSGSFKTILIGIGSIVVICVLLVLFYRPDVDPHQVDPAEAAAEAALRDRGIILHHEYDLGGTKPAFKSMADLETFVDKGRLNSVAAARFANAKINLGEAAAVDKVTPIRALDEHHVVIEVNGIELVMPAAWIK